MMATVTERIVLTFACDHCRVKHLLTSDAEGNAYAELFDLQLKHARCGDR